MQDMIAAFTANMKAAMLESEGRTAIRFSESLQAIQAETGEREERAVKNTLSACRADMEGYYHTALAAAEARSAESFGRVFERLDRLEKTAIADGKKSAKTHRELRNSIASAEERATVAMTEQRANIESYIDEQLQNNLEEVAAQVNKRFDVHNREWVGMKDSQEKLEDRLNALEGRQADLDAELYDLKVTKESLESEQKSVREMQEVVKAALKDLKKEQDTARDQTIELEARVDKAEKRVILVEEKQTASEETQPVFALNTDLGDAEARICKLEVQFGDIPKDHQDVWKADKAMPKTRSPSTTLEFKTWRRQSATFRRNIHHSRVKFTSSTPTSATGAPRNNSPFLTTTPRSRTRSPKPKTRWKSMRRSFGTFAATSSTRPPNVVSCR